MSVNDADISAAITDAGLAGQPLCVHSSLRSFGRVEGGADAVIDGLLAAGCTVLVPTFSWDYAVAPSEDMRPARNGWDYETMVASDVGRDCVYTPDACEVDAEMGAIPAAVVNHPDRVRGNHPLASFAAIGPRADELIREQAPLDWTAPLHALSGLNGFVVLMGVDHTKTTAIHHAERMVGREPFRRWANGPDGQPMEVQSGGCSDGFHQFDRVLAPIEQRAQVGESVWRMFPITPLLERAADAIRREPAITHCDDTTCGRCQDAVAGGPILNGEAQSA